MNAAVDRHRLAWPLATGVIGMVLAVAIQPTDDGFTVCPFAIITQKACPGCGLTRGITSLAGGELLSAWRYHPLAWLVALEVVFVYGWWVATRAGLVRRSIVRPLTAVLAATAVAMVAVWIARWTGGTLPPV